MLSEADQLRGLAGKAICRQSRRIEHRACLGCLLACPLKNGSGDIVGINVAAEEITDRKRAESNLAASEDRLRLLNEHWPNALRHGSRSGSRVINPYPRSPFQIFSLLRICTFKSSELCWSNLSDDQRSIMASDALEIKGPPFAH